MRGMELFKMGKNVRATISFGMWWVKWLKSRVGQGFIFHVIITAHYTFWWKFYWLN